MLWQRAVGTNQVDAAIMPAPHARELLAANQAKLVGWYSELDEQQFGALFVSTKNDRDSARASSKNSFVPIAAGTTDYAAALLRKDRNSKEHRTPDRSEAATTIARYVYPDRGDSGAAAVEAAAYFIEPQGGLDVTDIERQIAWYKAQGLIDKSVNAREVVDPEFHQIDFLVSTNLRPCQLPAA